MMSGLVFLSSGLENAAAPFSREEEAELAAQGFYPTGDSSADKADVVVCGRVSSTFDLAWRLHELAPFPDWGAVLALSQIAGRGQLRRSWFSPPGNLYVSFKIPASALFTGSTSSLLLALLLLEAFDTLGISLRLKWPNDLVLAQNGGYGKVGGILLEERQGTLMAGLGINCRHLPATTLLRTRAGLFPACLPDNFTPRDPLPLWIELVKKSKIIYAHSFRRSPGVLLRRAEDRLIWRGQEIRITDAEGEDFLSGRLEGLSGQGGLIVRPRTAYGLGEAQEITSGGIALQG